MSWLEQLKEGDEVVVSGGYHDEGVLVPVVKVTRTQIRTERWTFDRASGRHRTSDVWHRQTLYQATQERRDKIRHAALRNRLNREHWHSYPLPTLEAVVSLLAEEKKEQAE